MGVHSGCAAIYGKIGINHKGAGDTGSVLIFIRGTLFQSTDVLVIS